MDILELLIIKKKIIWCNLLWQLLETFQQRSLRACGPTQAVEASHPLLCPWNVCSSYCFHCGNPSKDVTLGEQCVIWTSLNWIHDWTQLRPLYKFLSFWRAEGEFSSSCSHPGQASYISPPLLIKLATWSGLLLSLVSPHPACVGANLRFHPGNLRLQTNRDDFCFKNESQDKMY